MGKKKGKNTQQHQEEERPNELGTEVVKDQGKGRKGKKKRFDEDEFDDDLLAIASEQGLKLPGPDAKGKGAGLGNDPLEVEPIKENIRPEEKGLKDEAIPTTTPTTTSKTSDSHVIERSDDNSDDEEEMEEATVHIKTKAEKKAAKKEKQKDKKEKKKPATTKPVEKDVSIPTVPPPTIETVTSEVGGATGGGEATVVGGATADVVEDEGEEEGEDDGKKKKKKKKKKDEEKKSAKPKKKVAGLLKIKEEIEALRAAQKKREEEELERQRIAEEEEKMQLEKLRLEKERKEKKKQKEKERKERLRKEGKLLTKTEKERRKKMEIQMAALIEQGIVVPPQKTGDGEGERKPVRYGRVRRKKKGGPEEVGVTGTEDTASTTPSEATGTSVAADEDSIKDNWDDKIEEGEDIKDNWDDEDSEEEEEEEDTPTGSGTPSLVPEVVATPTINEASSEAESESSSEESSEEEEDDLSPYEKADKRIHERRVRHKEERTPDLLRSPVVCVLGHVDTGKTKILDKIRHTNVQDGEAGGITQQIGATFVPEDAIKEQTKSLKEFSKNELKVPGLLIIDTPGHESFSNLRTRGSSMCDIAILVVDIMHGLEPQTIESLGLLRKGKVPFVVALNKIDRLFDWRRNPTSGVRETLKRQKQNTKDQFDERVQETVLQFAEQGLNAALFWDKVDFTEYIPLVPTSAISGDGMADLIAQIVTYSEKHLVDNLMFSKEIDAIVLEVKVIAGLGTTIDVILRNGLLNESDTMILTGMDGPFIAQARALLMPQPLRELRVKNAYVNHKTIIASQGVKICGKDLEKTLAGTPVLIAKKDDEIEVLKDEASSAITGALGSFKLKEKGVFVQASTLGSLEALLEFLKTSKIPYAGVNIGPVHKKDVMKASVMLERDNQWACILAFDVRVEREAQEMADNVGVKIFTADIIYHLFDNFTKYRAELKEKRRRENEHIAIFPCKLRILPNCVFNARNPIVVGVIIEAGLLKPGTPLCVPSKEFINIGIVTSLEANHKSVDIAHKGDEVCIKIDSPSSEAPKLYGRHFTLEDQLVSKISRESIDAVKAYFRDDLHKNDWQLMIELKRMFQVY